MVCSPVWPVACFSLAAFKLRVVFTFFNKEYATKAICGQQSPTHLLSSSLKKKFADPWSRLLLFDLWNVI